MVRNLTTIRPGLFMQLDETLSEKEAALENLTEQLSDSKQSSQGALYEKEQQVSILRVNLEKVRHIYQSIRVNLK